MSAQKILVLVTRTLIVTIVVLLNRDSLEMAYLVVLCYTLNGMPDR